MMEQNLPSVHESTYARSTFACLLRWYEAVPELKHKLWWFDVLYFDTPAASTS